jgi:hypothetical protein
MRAWFILLACLAVSASALEDYITGSPVSLVVSVYTQGAFTLEAVTTQACNVSINRFETNALIVNQSPMSPNAPNATHNFTWTPALAGTYGVDYACWFGGEFSTFYRQLEVLDASAFNETEYYASEAATQASTAAALSSTILSELRANATTIISLLSGFTPSPGGTCTGGVTVSEVQQIVSGAAETETRCRPERWCLPFTDWCVSLLEKCGDGWFDYEAYTTG